MYYYNQTQYDNVPYDNKSTPNKTETISSSGCGVCCACMVINNLMGKEAYTVKQMADFSIKNGARDSGGTNTNTLLTALAKANTGFSFTRCNNENDLVKHLKNGGMAIVNQGDAWNVFSSQGHFVVAIGMDGENIKVADPYWYSDKYDRNPRPQRIVKKTSNGCVVTPYWMSKATSDRKGGGYTAYFLCSYKKPNTPSKPRYDVGSNYKLTAYVNVWTLPNTTKGSIKRVKDVTVDGRKHCSSQDPNDTATLVTGTVVTCQGVSTDERGNIWLKIPSGYIPVYYNGVKRANWYKG